MIDFGGREGEHVRVQCIKCSTAQDVVIGTRCMPCKNCSAEGNWALWPEASREIEINWQELRILGVWAERWAAEYADRDPKMQRTVAAICGRIQAQCPDMPALTLSGELAGVRQAHDNVEVQGFHEDSEANAN